MRRLLLLVSATLAASVTLVPPAAAGTIDANVVDASSPSPAPPATTASPSGARAGT